MTNRSKHGIISQKWRQQPYWIERLRSRSVGAEEPSPAPTLAGHGPSPLIGARIDLDELTIYNDGIITVEVTSGFIEFIPSLTIGAEFGWFELKSFESEVTGTVNFDATVRASAVECVTYEYEKNLKTFTKTYFTMVGCVPVLVDVELEFNVGFTAEAPTQGWVEAGFTSSKSITVGAKWRNGDDDWGKLPSWRPLDLRKTLLEETYPRDRHRPPPAKQWSKTLGGNRGDVANSVQQTSDGGYILAGWTESFGAGGRDFYLIKTDRFGNAPPPQ